MIARTPAFLWSLFNQLRRRGFPLSPADYGALRQALRAGFGWESADDLLNLCVTLWAKSPREAEIVRALYAQHAVPQWRLPEHDAAIGTPPAGSTVRTPPDVPPPTDSKAGAAVDAPLAAEPLPPAAGGLPLVPPPTMKLRAQRLILVPQFPLSYREIAQAWRRLYRPTRFGPRVELDIDATIKRRARRGVAGEMVMIPRRRNAARLLLLVDTGRGMTPYRPFVDEAVAAIRNAGNLRSVTLGYFDTVPAAGATLPDRLLQETALHPQLDPYLHEIAPHAAGTIYAGAAASVGTPLRVLLASLPADVRVVVISEAGAALGRYDLYHLVDAVAFTRAVRRVTRHIVWLNPVASDRWAASTAGELARHVPMFPFTRGGMYAAVDVLRGRPHPLERPL